MRRCFFPLVSLLTIAGCGGGGDAPRPATDATRALVARTVADAQSALGHNSLESTFLPIFDVDAGSEPILPPGVGDRLGGAPEGTVPDFYYGDGVKAWVQVSHTETSYREDYSLDEAKAQKAGFYEIDGAEERYEFTAGPYAGARGTGTYEFQDLPGDDRDVLRASYRKTAPDGTTFEGESKWTGLAQTFKGTTTHPDGTADTFEGRDPDPRSGYLTFRSGRGTILTATFPESGAARGTIRGTADGLNASFTIDETGGMTVRFADGETMRFAGGRGLRQRAERLARDRKRA